MPEVDLRELGDGDPEEGLKRLAFASINAFRNSTIRHVWSCQELVYAIITIHNEALKEERKCFITGDEFLLENRDAFKPLVDIISIEEANKMAEKALKEFKKDGIGAEIR